MQEKVISTSVNVEVVQHGDLQQPPDVVEADGFSTIRVGFVDFLQFINTL